MLYISSLKPSKSIWLHGLECQKEARKLNWGLVNFSHFHYQQYISLRWRHNDHAGVSNHQANGCLLNRLFRRRSKKTSKLRVTGLCAGNSPGPVNSPHKGPVTQNFYVFSDLRPNKRLSKQSTHWWFETPSRSLWRTCYDCGINSTQHRSQSTRHRLHGSRRKPTISYF